MLDCPDHTGNPPAPAKAQRTAARRKDARTTSRRCMDQLLVLGWKRHFPWRFVKVRGLERPNRLALPCVPRSCVSAKDVARWESNSDAVNPRYGGWLLAMCCKPSGMLHLSAAASQIRTCALLCGAARRGEFYNAGCNGVAQGAFTSRPPDRVRAGWPRPRALAIGFADVPPGLPHRAVRLRSVPAEAAPARSPERPGSRGSEARP